MYKWDICEGEILATSAESPSHHSVDPEIWARQNSFLCTFQIKWLGTAHHTKLRTKKKIERNNRWEITKHLYRLEGTPSCHLVQVFPQSRANYLGFCGPCLGFHCLPGWRFPILCLAQCLSVLLAILLRRWASHSPAFVHCVLPIAVHLQEKPGCIFQYLPQGAEESRKITLSFCFLRLNKPSSLYIMFSRFPPILSAEPSHFQVFLNQG